MVAVCPSDNGSAVDDCFFCPEGIHWDAHRIGWAVAGGCAASTTLITLFTLTMHATHYQQPDAQRQVMRVLLMPCVYAVVSFLSYRYYTSYEYYVLAEAAYEAITLSAFLMLLMELVPLNTSSHDIKENLMQKDKRKLPFPFNFWRFRASKPYFMHALSFSVMQYVIIRPLISIIGIICEYYNVLCPQEYSVHFAEVYLDSVDFVSISVALYGLIVFYVLCKDELKGRRPLSKFLAIKLIVFFTFYQSFVFSILQNYNVIKPTAVWTADNVSNGLSALCTTVEMVFFSIYMGWAYNWTEYTNPATNPHLRKTSFKTYLQAIWDTINFTDFVVEIWLALHFFVDFLRGKEGTRGGEATKMQKAWMPDSINRDDRPNAEKHNLSAYPRGQDVNLDQTQTSAPQPNTGSGPYPNYDPEIQAQGRPSRVRTASGNFIDTIRSPSSYQRLAENQPSQTGGGTQWPTPQPNYPTEEQYMDSPHHYSYTQYPPPPHTYSPSSRSQTQTQTPTLHAHTSPASYTTSPVGLSAQVFPSAHPTGEVIPGSAGTTSARSGESEYVTPISGGWTGRTGDGYDNSRHGREGMTGIEGNPRLY